MDALHIVYALLGLLGLFHVLRAISVFILELCGYEVTVTKWWKPLNAKKKEKK
jgi:hypothetical protein